MRTITLTISAMLVAAAASGTEVRGKVSEANGREATIVTESSAPPAVGDKVEIFFKIAGIDDEISVASGKVTSVSDKIVKIAVEESSGAVMKDQLARITSVAPPVKPGASAAPTSGGSLVGDWVSTEGRGTVSFSFKEDGTLLWAMEDAQYGQSTGGRYRLDPSTQPKSIELTELDLPELKDEERLRGVYEFQSDGRLRLDFSIGQQEKKEFTASALTFSRATLPVVRPSKPAPPAPTPEPEDSKLVTEAGIKRSQGDHTGAQAALDKAIALNPKNALAYFWRGMCFSEKKAWGPAVADFEKAMALDPSMKLEDLIQKTKAVMETAKPAK